jgi:hypothetical protein
MPGSLPGGRWYRLLPSMVPTPGSDGSRKEQRCPARWCWTGHAGSASPSSPAAYRWIDEHPQAAVKVALTY